MPAPEVTFQLLDGIRAAAVVSDVAALHAEVYSGRRSGPAGDLAGPGSDRARGGAASGDAASGDPGPFARRFRKQCRQPGFVLAEARSGGYLLGCAAGMPLRPSTSWWRELTTPLPADVTAEQPGRTFALVEFAVRASWRRQGIGRYLIDLSLRSRSEERATVVVPPAAHAAQAAFQNWGWQKVARTRGPDAGATASDVLVLALRADG